MMLSMKIEHSFHLWYIYIIRTSKEFIGNRHGYFSFYETQDLDQYISL